MEAGEKNLHEKRGQTGYLGWEMVPSRGIGFRSCALCRQLMDPLSFNPFCLLEPWRSTVELSMPKLTLSMEITSSVPRAAGAGGGDLQVGLG